MTQYRPPVLLDAAHQLDRFVCRSEEQSTWLHRHARQSAASGGSRVQVVTTVDSPDVVAYYAWCMASVTLSDLPMRARVGTGRYPQPVPLLARLGVDTSHEGRGLGAALLRDVIVRAHALGREIGCRGLLVHAESDDARNFYMHLVPEVAPSPTDEMHLFVLMKDIQRTLG